MLAVNKNLFQALESALKASNFYQDPERKDLAVQAVLLSHHLSDLQRAQLESPDLETIDQTRTLLEKFLERCGNPNDNPVIKRLAKVDSRLSILKGSVRDDGRISDFYLTGPGSRSKVRHVASDVDAVLEAYYVNCRGVTLEETLKQFTDQAAIATLGDSALDTLRDRLLASDEVFWNNKLFYPATQFYQGRNGFDLIDFFEAQVIDLGEDNPFTAKLRRQCQIVREQMKMRPLEEIPINLFACAKGRWLDLEILNKFERMEKIGRLYYRPNGRIDIEVRMAYRDAREPEYLVNFINGEKLTYDPDSETGFLGTNSKEGKDWLSAFTADFHDWLLVSEYRSLVEESYNRRFNGYIQKQYSDEPFPIAKFTPPPGVKPHGYQWQDVRQFLAQGRGLLGWSVGLGKTLAAIMLVLALKQYGYCDKPAIVVPKSLIGNWKREIDRWTTGVNYLIIGLTQVFYEDGTPVRCLPGYEVIHDSKTKLPQISAAGNYLLKVKRQKEIVEMDPVEFERRSELQFREDSLDEKLRKIYLVATNDYDIVLMWRETWKSIPLSAARELAYLEDLIGRHLPKDERKGYFGDAKNKETIGGRRATLRHKARQEAREQVKRDYKEQETRAKIGARLNEQRGEKLSTREIFFELTRLDCVLLDEAHAVSNLWTPQGIHATTKGASVQPSQRSYDFYQKSRYIKELHNGKMVYLLTATPVKNSPLDLYSLLQYIADEEFLLRGIRTVDEFLDTFGKVADLTAPTLDGQVRTDRALIGFRLLLELRALVNKYAIIRDSKNAGINEPEEYRIEHVIEMTPEQSYLYALLTDRMEQGLELRRTREWDLLSACPELEPFSVLADMDKLTLSPQHYLTSTVYGAGLDNLEDIAYSLADNAYELVGPIHNYRLQFDETLERLTDREAAERKISIHHATRKLQIGDTVTDQLDFSDEYKALVQEMRGSDRVQQEIGTLAQYSEKHFGWRCEAGCRREILNVTYELHQESGIYKWQWVAGYPYHSEEMYELIRGVLEADKAVAAARRELSDLQRTKEQTDHVKRMIKAAQKRVKQAYKQATAARLNCQVQPGSQITHQDVEFVLNDNHRWERLDGEPMYDDRSPKFDRLVQEAVMYYHAGCIKAMRLDTGGYFTATPHGLFTKPDGSPDIETCLANWRTIKVGDEYEVKLGDDLVKSVVVQIGGSNQIIFCDQVGASKKDKSARLFTRLQDQLEAAGIPPIEVEFVYGSVSPQTRQAIVQRFAAGVCRIVIGPTVCMGEGMNLQGSVYPCTALYHLTFWWTASAIIQRNGRCIRQGNFVDRVDTHYLHAVGTIDQYKHFVIKKKLNCSNSVLLGEADEMMLETDTPSIDELTAALSRDPVQAKRRLLEAQYKEMARQTQERKDKAVGQFWQLANHLSLVLRQKLEWRESETGETTIRKIRELAVRLKNNPEFDRKDLLAVEDYLSSGHAPFFATKTRKIYVEGDYVEDNTGRLFRIRRIQLQYQTVELVGVLRKDGSPITDWLLRKVPVKIFSPTESDKVLWMEDLSRFGYMGLINKQHVWFAFFQPTQMGAEEILELRLSQALSYLRLSSLLTKSEMQTHRGSLIERLLKQEPYLLCWEGSELVIMKKDGAVDLDRLALPCDPDFEDGLCRTYFCWNGDPMFRAEPRNLVLSLAQQLIELDDGERLVDRLLKRGEVLAAELYPSIDEVRRWIGSWFVEYPAENWLPFEQLMEGLGQGRGVEAQRLENELSDAGICVRYYFELPGSFGRGKFIGRDCLLVR